MRYAKLTVYEVSKEDYLLIKKALGGYVFNRVTRDGTHKVKLDAEQREVLDKLGISYENN